MTDDELSAAIGDDGTASAAYKRRCEMTEEGTALHTLISCVRCGRGVRPRYAHDGMCDDCTDAELERLRNERDELHVRTERTEAQRDRLVVALCGGDTIVDTVRAFRGWSRSQTLNKPFRVKWQALADALDAIGEDESP